MSFDFLRVRAAAQAHLNKILEDFRDFQEDFRILVANASETGTVQTNAAAQVALNTQLHLCAEVIESLETRQQTLNRQKALQNQLGEILSEIQRHLNPDELFSILTSLYDATNTAVDFARNNIQLQQKQNELLTKFENQLNMELGGLTERVNIQNIVARSRETLKELLASEIEKLNADIARQIQHAQLASDQIFNTLSEALSEDYLYYELIETARAYLGVAPAPDAYIERLNQFLADLEDWKEEYGGWVALLEDDAIYQELLSQPTVADDLHPDDRHRLGCLFGKNGTSLQARLEFSEPTPEVFHAAYAKYRDAYERWIGEIHFLGSDQRAIVEHGCKWMDRIEDVRKGVRQ